MTYKEANAELEKHKYLIYQPIKSEIVHLVKGFFIAPEQLSFNVRQVIWHALEDGKDNFDILLEKRLISNKLEVYVVLLIEGSFLFLLLNYYLGNNLLEDKSNI